MIKKLTFGLELDEQLKAQAQALDGFVEFVDDEYFLVEYPEVADEDRDYVFFKRNNGEIVV